MADKMCTEVVIMPLFPDADLTDQHSGICKAVALNNTMTAAQPGYRRGFWAVDDSSSKAFITLTDWDSVSSHERFMAQGEHEGLVKALMQVTNGNMQMFHTSLGPELATATSSEVQSGHIDIVLGLFAHQQIGDAMKRQSGSSGDNDAYGVGPKTYACGWSMEDGTFWSKELAEIERDGKGKEKVWVAVYQWDDLAAQQAAHNADVVRKETAWILAAGGERRVHHLVLAEYSTPMHAAT